jgi:hypothetical protein
MCGPSSDEQYRVIKQPSKEMTTMMTPEPFLSAEIEYRQKHLSDQYGKGRRHWVPRRPSLELPPARRRLVTLAFGD